MLSEACMPPYPPAATLHGLLQPCKGQRLGAAFKLPWVSRYRQHAIAALCEVTKYSARQLPKADHVIQINSWD